MRIQSINQSNYSYKCVFCGYHVRLLWSLLINTFNALPLQRRNCGDTTDHPHQPVHQIQSQRDVKVVGPHHVAKNNTCRPPGLVPCPYMFRRVSSSWPSVRVCAISLFEMSPTRTLPILSDLFLFLFYFFILLLDMTETRSVYVRTHTYTPLTRHIAKYL